MGRECTTSRYWLPRESRLFAEIEFAFGETALTGTSKTTQNQFMALGRPAPQNRTDGKGVQPNANVALTAAPLRGQLGSEWDVDECESHRRTPPAAQP